MSGDKPGGAIAGVAVVLAACCGLHAVLLLVGGITLAGLSLGRWALASGGLIVLALVVMRYARRWRRGPVPPRDEREGQGDARRSRTG